VFAFATNNAVENAVFEAIDDFVNLCHTNDEILYEVTIYGYAR
jgi:hypothetical protein